MTRSLTFRAVLLPCVAALLLPVAAPADTLTGTTDPTTLTAGYSFNWFTELELEFPGEPIDFGSPVTADSTGILLDVPITPEAVTVNTPGGDLFATLTDVDAEMYQAGSADPVTFTFATGSVSGFGISLYGFSSLESATLAAYNAADALIGSVTIDIDSATGFAGILDSNRDIASVTLTTGNDNQYAFGTGYFAVAPEPGTLVLLAMALLLMLLTRVRWSGAVRKLAAARRVCIPCTIPCKGRLLACAFLIAPASHASAATFSETGTLDDPQDDVTFVLDLPFDGSFTLQTYGFGGGINLDSDVISPGGFDPFVGVFEGTGADATFIDGTSDILSNYTSEPNACGPAGTVDVRGYGPQCGDVSLDFSNLTAGLCTIVLSDALYYPAAASEFPPAYLGDGFYDFTGGSSVFQTCFGPDTCATDTGNWALDINVAEDGATLVAAGTPEPASFALVCVGLLAAAFGIQRRMKNHSTERN